MGTILRISDAASLALHAVILLAGAGKGSGMPVPEMARSLGASEAHLSKVMQRLARARLVSSRRGPGGGFTLARAAGEITLLAVYEAIDGPLGDTTCLLGRRACVLSGCALGDLLRTVTESVRTYFADKTVADICARPARTSRKPTRGGSR
jgi:Rrf2 family protein